MKYNELYNHIQSPAFNSKASGSFSRTSNDKKNQFCPQIISHLTPWCGNQIIKETGEKDNLLTPFM